MTDASEVPTPPPPPLKKKNYAWVGFFVFVVLASVGAAWLMIWYNLSIQLTPEKLQAARELWKEHGPRAYKMVYTKRLNDDPREEVFSVTVRDGNVEEVLLAGRPLPPEQRPYHSMDRIFSDIERFMQLDKMPNEPKVYVRATFDEKTGALRQYIRRVMGSQERIEMNFTLEKLTK